MRLSRARRVRKRPEFELAQREGRRVTCPHFILVIARSTSASIGARLGITASRKLGNAVRRNRMKRIVREAFRRTEAFLPPGFDVIVICRRDEALLSALDVEREWQRERPKIEKAAAALAANSRLAKQGSP